MSDKLVSLEAVKSALENAYYGEMTLGELLEMLDDISPAQQEMSAREYMDALMRLFIEDYYVYNTWCKLMLSTEGDKRENLHKAIAIVEQWAKEHPVDVKPAVKSKWLCESTKCRMGYNDYEYWNKWRCSCCGYIRTEGWEHTSEGQEPNVNLCENCGADMRRQNE